MRKLSGLGSRSLRHRKGRSALTAAGIVLGVAIFFGVIVASASSEDAVGDFVERITGRADVVGESQGAFGSGFSPEVVERIRGLEDVAAVNPTYGFPTELLFREEGRHVRGGAFVIGANFEDAQRIQDFEFASGRPYAPGADEIVLTPSIAERMALEVGDTVSVLATGGRTDTTLVGILSDTGALGGDDQAYTSIPAARRMNADEGRFNGIGIVLTEGVDADAWIEANEAAEVDLVNAEQLASGFREFVRFFGTFLTFFATITLFIGAFLIYLTLSMAVIERTRMYGTLRALGATSRQVRRVVVREALTLGAVSSVVGLVVGLGLAYGLMQLIGALFDLSVTRFTVTPGAVVASLLVGLVVTLLASLLPARRAARLAPVEAMKGDYAADMRLGRGWFVGAALLTAAIGIRVMPGETSEALGPLTILGLLAGAILLVPLVLRPLAAVLGRLTQRIAPGVGDIAVLHLVRERSRSAYTLGLIMVVMAMLFSLGGLYLSIIGTVDDLIDRQLGGDAFVEADAPMPPGVRDELAARDDVEDVSPLAFGQANVLDGDQETTLFIQMAEPDAWFRISGFLFVEGSDATALEAFASGPTVLLGEEPARGLEAGLDDTVTMSTREGPVDFTVGGVFTAPPGPPVAAISFADGRTYFGADRAMAFAVDLAEGTDPDAFKAAVESDTGETYALEVETAATQKAEARSQVLQFFRIIWAILAVAAVVGLLGLANTLAMSVLQRFREIGILRSIGVTRSQTARMVLTEAATMGLAAFVLSIPLGFAMTAITIGDTSGDFAFTTPVVYPWAWIPIVFAFGLVITVLAAWAPGRRASRLEVVGALQYE